MTMKRGNEAAGKETEAAGPDKTEQGDGDFVAWGGRGRGGGGGGGRGRGRRCKRRKWVERGEEKERKRRGREFSRKILIKGVRETKAGKSQRGYWQSCWDGRHLARREGTRKGTREGRKERARGPVARAPQQQSRTGPGLACPGWQAVGVRGQEAKGKAPCDVGLAGRDAELACFAWCASAGWQSSFRGKRDAAAVGL